MIKAQLTLFLIVMGSTVYAAGINQQEMSFVSPNVTAATNVHNNDNYCLECHEKNEAENGKLFLRFDDYSLTCRCHGYNPENYAHPLGVELSERKRRTVPPDFPLEDGKITCNTCHDITMQCESGCDTLGINRNFLRINSSQNRTAICYSCHNEPQYARLSPHKQFDDQGNIIKSKCRYCHKVKPDEQKDTLKKQRSGESGNVEFVAEFFTLCFRCHFKKTVRHVLGSNSFLTNNANHLKRPPEKIHANMKASEEKYGIILPLDDEGSLTCATCHNPHQKWIIPRWKAGAKGASEKSRLRLTIKGNRICQACHNK